MLCRDRQRRVVFSGEVGMLKVDISSVLNPHSDQQRCVSGRQVVAEGVGPLLDLIQTWMIT
jgi:hypothetical protein